MYDTVKLEIISKQIEKVVSPSTSPSVGMTSGQIALFAAAIGASAAILSQLVVFFLTRYKERSNLKIELIAEERRVSMLLTEYYKDLVMHKVHKQYWYRTSEILRPGTEDSKDSHERHFVSNQKSFDTATKIREIIAQYFKIVTHFTNLTRDNDVISGILSEIKSFKPRKASLFSEVIIYDDLVKAEVVEEEKLNEVYLFYSRCFDRINIEMIKNL